MTYEVLFFDGNGATPAYHLVGSVEGETPEDALAANLEGIIQQVRRTLNLSSDDVSDRQILDSTYMLRGNGLVPGRHKAGLVTTRR
jgi:hypothetical protein